MEQAAVPRPTAAGYFRKERRTLHTRQRDAEVSPSRSACMRVKPSISAAGQSDPVADPERSAARPKSSRYGAPSGLALNTLPGTMDPCAGPRACAASMVSRSSRRAAAARAGCSHPDLTDSSSGIPWRNSVRTEGRPAASTQAATGTTMAGGRHSASCTCSRSNASVNPAGAGVRHRFSRNSLPQADSPRTRNTDAASHSPSGT